MRMWGTSPNSDASSLILHNFNFQTIYGITNGKANYSKQSVWTFMKRPFDPDEDMREATEKVLGDLLRAETKGPPIERREIR